MKFLLIFYGSGLAFLCMLAEISFIKGVMKSKTNRDKSASAFSAIFTLVFVAYAIWSVIYIWNH